jgi:hypothetical protein
MRFIKFSRNKIYLEDIFSDYGYQMLGMFLIDEIGRDEKLYRDWVLNTKSVRSSGNSVFAKKEHGNIVLFFDPSIDPTDEEMLDWIFKSDPMDSGGELVVPCKEFIHIIEQWVLIRKRDFDEIWIKNEGNVYWLEGVK